MVSVQKINFKSNTPSLLQQNSQASAIPVTTYQPDSSRPEGGLKTAKTISYVGAGMALAALGVVAVVSHKNGEISKALKELKEVKPSNIGEDSDLVKKIGDVVSEKVETLKSDITKTVNEQIGDLKNVVEENRKIAKQDTVDLGKWQDGQIGDLRANSNKNAGVTYNFQSMSSSNSSSFLSESVGINGKNLNLASIARDIENYEVKQSFEREIRSQATKSMFGLRKPLAELPDNPFIRIVSVELKPFSPVGGMSIVPKELTEEMPKILNKHNNPSFVLDTIMYTGRVGSENGQEVSWRLIEDKANKTFAYQKFLDNKPIASSTQVELIDEMDVNLVGQSSEKVRLFRTGPIDGASDKFDTIKHLFDKEYLKTIEEKIAQVSSEGDATLFETNSFKIVRKNGNELFVPKVRYNLWDNRKFDLDIPIDGDSDIYCERNISSGLAEREVMFCKYIYEHTIKMKNNYNGAAIKDKGGNILLKADAFILNDWQTGPFAAMLRLGTIAKKYYGKLSSDVAKEIQETPVMSLLHNAKYHGDTGYGQEKFLNIMFDELAAKVVPNAFAPNLSSMNEHIPANLLNPLFDGERFCPLNMLVQYTDILDPVSEKYGYEIATNEFFGSGLSHLYNIRSKMRAQHGSEDYVNMVRNMAIKNDVNLDGITDAQILKPTMRPKNNGLNKSNNVLTAEEIIAHDKMSTDEFVKYGFEKLIPYKDNMSAAEALKMKNHNKALALKYVKDAVKEASGYQKSGRLSVWLGDMTNLDGVTVKTPTFETAGRIDSQKGYELYINAVRHYIENIHKEGDEVPVFIIQGQVLKGYGEDVLHLVENFKKELIAKGHQKFADRFVFFDRGDGFKYTISKLITDHPIMASIFEPKGLTHIEFGYKSGGVSVGNDTGGILVGLEDGVNVFGVKYEPNPPNGESPAHYIENIKNFAHGLFRAVDVHKDEDKYAKMVKASWDVDMSWTAEGGTAFQYADDLAELGLVKKTW